MPFSPTTPEICSARSICRADFSGSRQTRRSQTNRPTIIVANALLLYGGPELVLNTNYTATPVPVPSGVGPKNATITLAQ